MLDREEAHGGERDDDQNRPTAERRDVVRRLHEPPRAHREVRAPRPSQEPQQPLVEVPHVALEDLVRDLDEAEEGQEDAQGGDKHGGLLARD